MYKIERDNNGINICYKDYYNESYECFIRRVSGSFLNTFGLIVYSHYIDINVVEPHTYNVPNFNISIMTIVNDDYPSKENSVRLFSDDDNDSKFDVNVNSTGYWDDIEDDVNVHLTGYLDYLDVRADLHKKANFTKEQAYVYKPITWTPRLYQPLNYTDKSLNYYIIVTESSAKWHCEYLISEMLRCRWKECNKKEELIDYIMEAKCVTPETINETLSSVTENIDKVSILNYVDDLFIDLKKLPHQVVVEIVSQRDIYESSNENSKEIKDQAASKLIWKTIIINGAVKDKVSFLTVSNSYLKIIESPLNIYILRLLYSEIVPDESEKVQCHDVIVDFASHANHYSNFDLFEIKQYGLIIPPDYYSEDNDLTYKIEYSTSYWSLYYKSNSDYDYRPIDYTYGNVPKDLADSICLIILSHNFEFSLDDEFVTNVKKVNLTLFNYLSNDDIRWFPIDQSAYNITLKTVGEYWSETNKIADIEFTGFYDLINVNVDSPNLNVTKTEIFEFKPHPLIIPKPTIPAYPTEIPSPTSIPSKTPVPEIVDSLYEGKDNQEITDVNKLNSDLDEIFKKLDDKNDDTNKVVIIKAKSFPFNKNLNDNQYIKPLSDSKIEYIDGKLNLVFPDEGDVIISLNDKKNANISLKGEGSISFESNEDEINIDNKAIINGSFSIKVPDLVKTVTINSIYLSKQGKIECKSSKGKNVPISVNDINSDPHTTAELNSIIVNGTFSIAQSSIFELHDVEFKDSKVVYNLFNLISYEYIFKGEFIDTPTTIEIVSDVSPDYESNTIHFAKGEFEDNLCEEWGNRIQFKGKKQFFNCYDSSKLLQKSMKELNIYLSEKSEPDPKPPGKGDGGGKGFPLAAIIGIIVGVIVVIVIIIIVVVVIKKKKKNNSSNKSENENIEEKQNEV